MSMKKISEASFVGKTISKIDNSAVNVLNIYFADGTSVAVWIEPVGYGIYGFMQSEVEAASDSNPKTA